MRLTEAQINEAKRLKNEGVSPSIIAKKFEVERGTILRAIDPVWAAKRCQQINEARRIRNGIEGRAKAKLASTGKPVINSVERRPTEAEFRHAVSLIPSDNRDLTGKLMGDPLPGDARRPHLLRPASPPNAGASDAPDSHGHPDHAGHGNARSEDRCGDQARREAKSPLPAGQGGESSPESHDNGRSAA